MSGYHKKFDNCNNDEPDAQLRIAVQRRDRKLAKSLLNNGAQINYPHARPCATIIHLAVMNHDVEMVSMLLDSGAYLNKQNTCGETALHLATIDRDVKMVKVLLDKCIYFDYLDIKDNNGKTALHLAAECGSEPIVKLLVNKGANVNTIAKDHSRPIEKVISTWRNNIFKLLVCHGANVDITLSDGESLLLRAIKSCEPSTVKCILEKSSVDKNINKTCLTTAVLKGNEEIEQLLIKHGFEVEPQCVNNSKFFHAIVKRGYTKFVTDLLTMGADVNALRQETTKYTLLHTACINRKLEMARLLIQHDINLNVKDHKEKTAIFYAVKNGDFNIVKLLITNGACVEDDPDLLNIAALNQCSDTVQILLEHGVDINACDSFGKTALHSAFVKQSSQLNNDVIYKIEPSLIRVLLNKGADVNMPMNDGRTALHLAVQTDNKEIVNTLLEYNPKVSVSDAKGMTPLHSAAQTENSKIVDSLLNKNADITAVDIKGMTALHFAAEVGHLDIIKNLLKYEPNADAIDEFNSTLLHGAAKYGYLDTINCVNGEGSTALLIAISHSLSLEFIQELLTFGADVNYRNTKGETALHIASKMKQREIIEILLRYGADINIKCQRNKTALLHTYEYKRPKFFSSRVIDCDCEEYGCGCADDCYSWELRDQYDEEEFRFDHFSCHVKDCCPIVEVFKHHILKLKAVKFYVDKNNILGLEYFEELKRSPVVDNSKVNMELESMKNERIGNSNITFYHFLTSNIHQLARYVKNKNIVEVINSNDYELIFPIFSDIIESRFHIGIERHKLLARCDFLCDFFVDLPDTCIDEILSYLNNQELRFLTNAYKNQYVLNKRKIFLNL
ncbi:putative ankyrin repeat protein RF_0381 isoform X2 [Microplitis mediator]|uniref:putative ankyrin repeat protein RF_0381 isoform X2 n=1 Tax=Microplitis mediator TaxID=375433 RepID=UPI0025542F0C|nr:putative ankyrin repeat protein RF_0381 isoform X2 [Microplitis mediator]